MSNLTTQQLDDLTADDGHIKHLTEAGYTSIFDIVRDPTMAFCEKVSSIPPEHAKHIHALATGRVQSLASIFRAYRARNEPILQGLPKFGASPFPATLAQALERSLGGAPDFSDLFPERAEDGYAQATSIQSLFSPGRYLAELYKIAQGLHTDNSPLNLDARRPDIKSLVLSEKNLLQEVSTLDILIEVLLAGPQRGAEVLSAPTDPITAATAAAKPRLAKSIVPAISNEVERPAKAGNEPVTLDCPVATAVRVDGTPTVGQTLSGTYIYADPDDNPEGNSLFQWYRAGSTAGGADGAIAGAINRTYTLVPADEGATLRFGVTPVTSTAPPASERMALLEQTYYPMTLPYHDNLVQIRSALGSKNSSLQQVWAILTDYQALCFAPVAAITPPTTPSASVQTPSPASREELQLTPATYQLLVGPPATAATIQRDYHLPTNNISVELKLAATFTDRTGLTYNQLVDLTGQADPQAQALEQAKSRFFKYGEAVSVPVSEYGQSYIASAYTPAQPLLMVPGTMGNPYKFEGPEAELNLTADNAVALTDRAERLIRLQRQVQIEFHQLDWLIKHANSAYNPQRESSPLFLDTPILEAIAEFQRLRTAYGISSDSFSSFIGRLNPYSTPDTPSLYQQLFTSPTDGTTVPLYATLNFDPAEADVNASIVAGGLGVSANELFAMAQLAFDGPQDVDMTSGRYGQLYRQAMIPKMLGLNFYQARVLWTMLNPGRDIAKVVAGAATLETLAIIRQTETVLAWMSSHQLDIDYSFKLTTERYSENVTPELFNFVDNIYTSLSSDPAATSYQADESLSDPLKQKLYTLTAAAFKVKANVMQRLITWLDGRFTTQGADEEPVAYGLGNFWADIEDLFSGAEPTLERLQDSPNIARYSQAMAQYALIALWANLTEQDLTLIVDTPAQFSGTAPVSAPSLSLLLSISRLKEWQQRVRVPQAEAMSYFLYANKTSQTAPVALTMLAYIHGWDLETTTAMNTFLVGQSLYSAFPKSFAQVLLLEAWMQVGQQTAAGSAGTDGLYRMSLENVEAQASGLIQLVADNFAAALQA
jgi:hypothetical protein